MTPRDMVLSIQQVRKWTNPPGPWMVNGYSSTHDLFYVRTTDRTLTLPAGGWTLNAAHLLRVQFDSGIGQEGIYRVDFNQNRVYHGLWQPRVGETVTESFFWEGDLLAISYRLLRVAPEDGVGTPS